MSEQACSRKDSFLHGVFEGAPSVALCHGHIDVTDAHVRRTVHRLGCRARLQARCAHVVSRALSAVLGDLAKRINAAVRPFRARRHAREKRRFHASAGREAKLNIVLGCDQATGHVLGPRDNRRIIVVCTLDENIKVLELAASCTYGLEGLELGDASLVPRNHFALSLGA